MSSRRSWRQLGVRGKLITLVLVLLIPVVALDAYSIYGRFEDRINQELVESRLYADAVSTAFDNYLENLWDTELALGIGFADRAGTMTADDIEATLRQEFSDLTAVRMVSWVSPAGVTIASTLNGRRGVVNADREYIQRVIAGEDKVLSDLLVGRASEAPTVIVARAIRKDGRLAGLVVAGLDLPRLDQVLPVISGQHRSFGMLDRTGGLVYHSDAPDLTMAERQTAAIETVRQSVQDGVLVRRSFFDPVSGVRRTGVSLSLPKLGWTFYTGAPVGEVLAGARSVLARDAVVLCLVALLTLLLATFISRGILVPLSALQRVATAISAGDLGARVAQTGFDEVAAAAQTFDTMASRIQLADEVQKARVTAVAHLTQQALSGADTRDLAEQAAGLAVLSLGMEAAAVLELVPGTSDLRVQAGVGLDDDVLGRTLGAGEHYVGAQVLARGTPFVLEETDGLPEMASARLGGKQVRSSVGVPITAGERPYGVMTVCSVRRHAFTDPDIHFLQAVANVLASAIEDSRIKADQAFLSRAGNLLSGSLDYETTLQTVTELATTHLSDWCVVDLMEGNLSLLRRVQPARRTPANLAGARLLTEVASTGATAWAELLEVLAKGEPRLIAHATDTDLQKAARNPEHLAYLRTLGVVSGMLIPLVARGRVLGAMILMSCESGRRYTEADVALATELARRAALALDHAQMYRGATAALEQRDRALAEAELQRRRLGEVFERAPAAICVKRGPEHTVVMANQTYLAAIGGRDVVGKPLFEALPEMAGQGFRQLMDQVYTTGIPYEGTEVRVMIASHGDGVLEERFHNYIHQPLRDVDGNVEGILSYSVDVTEQVLARRQIEQLASDLQAMAKQQAAIATLGQRVIGGAAPAEVIAEAVELVKRVLGSDSCRIMELMPDGQHLRICSGAGWTPTGIVPVAYGSGRLTQAGYTLQVQQPVVVDDYRREDRFEVMPALQEIGVISSASVVIPGDEGPFGILSVHTAAHRTFTPDDLNFLTAVAHAVSRAVGHQRDERRLRTQLAVARILADSPGAAEAAPLLLQAIGDGLGWDVGVFWTADREAGTLTCTATWEREGVAVQPFLAATAVSPQGRGWGLAGRAWEKGQAVWSADACVDPGFLRREVAAEAGLHGGLWIPLLLAGEVCGVIECFSRETRRPEPAVIQMADAVGSQIGQFLQRTQAEAELRRLNAELEERVAARTAELAAANKELEAFSYTVSHDLRAPLRTIDGFSQALVEDCSDRLGADGQDYLRRIRGAARQMSGLIDDILRLSRVMRSELHRERVNLTALAEAVAAELKQGAPERPVAFRADTGLTAVGDERLLRVVLQNLLANAWKFTGKQAEPQIHFGSVRQGKETVFFVSDNGAGFDMSYADRLFVPFQRLHTPSEFEGTGIGLATVQRIIGRHGGRIWAEGRVGAGATFYFTLS